MKYYLFAFLLAFYSPILSAERIKDLVDVAGVRSNQLIGYGLVAGLQGTGDGQDLRITGQSLQSLLSGLGVSVDGPVSEFDLGDSLVSLATQNVQQPIQTDNLAAVLVTAEVPPSPTRPKARRQLVHCWHCGESTRRQPSINRAQGYRWRGICACPRCTYCDGNLC